MTTDLPSIDAVIEAFIVSSMDASEANRAADEAKARKDDLAERLIPYIEETADDGERFEVVRDGKSLGRLQIQSSSGYSLCEGITYQMLVDNGLMVKRSGKFLRWYPQTTTTKKQKAEAAAAKEEL